MTHPIHPDPVVRDGVMPLARHLGELLDRDPIPDVEPIAGHVFRLRAKRLWPPEVWAEMQAIYATPDPVSGTASRPMAEATTAADTAALSVADLGRELE